MFGRIHALTLASALSIIACASPPKRAAQAPALALAGATVPVVPVPSASSPGGVSARDLGHDPGGVRWTFRTASPIVSPPTVCRDGSIYVPTGEGAVHALGSDGAFRWTYNLSGHVSGAGACDAEGNVYFGSTSKRLYSLRADGHARAVHSLPVGVKTNVLWSPSGQLFFGGADDHVWAFSSRAGVLWRADRKLDFAFDLVLGQGGRRALLANDAGVFSVAGLFRVKHAKLDAAATESPIVTQRGIYVATRSGVRAMSHDLTPSWFRSGVEWFGAADERLAAIGDGKLCELNPVNGSAVSCAPLGDALVAPPVFAGALTALPMEGSVKFVQSGEPVAVIPLDGTPSFRPVFHAPTNQLYVVAAGGRLVALGVPPDVKSH